MTQCWPVCFNIHNKMCDNEAKQNAYIFLSQVIVCIYYIIYGCWSIYLVVSSNVYFVVSAHSWAASRLNDFKNFRPNVGPYTLQF